MLNSRKDFFTTIKSEGIILPISILQRIIAFDEDIIGIKPQDYHLAPTERINEAISRSWQRATILWRRFNEQTSKSSLRDTGTAITRERWLLPLFQELGFGNLQLSKGFEIEGKSYPVSHVGKQVIIHLVGYNIKLDERTAGVAGAARMSPHSLVQLFLNSSKEYLWGIVSNGYTLRLLRDDISITRQSFIEFDLKGMFDGEVYSDFVLLWLLCHQSRFEGSKAEEAIIEKWSQISQQTGARLLEQLREGVIGAIHALGTGFIKYSSNRELRNMLISGILGKQEYYRQLLRLVYRMIFLFVAEDRNVLLLPDASIESKELYQRYYSMSHIKYIARHTDGNGYCDLYESLKVVMRGLEGRNGMPEIALPALGSTLWTEKFIENLSDSQIDNAHLIKAVQALAFTIENGYRMPVNFKNLGSEELGSVYESLLEMHPEVDVTAGVFELRIVSGSERKTTGSYYTPTNLINCLLDSAVEPVIEKARKEKSPEKAILDIKVCDPACGSGHFLVAVAHRLAKHLSAIRTGDEEPSPNARRHALREIISNCIYGVDRNEMAVELCRINLWLESLDPGKPLAFLEHHIQCGNSLLGTTSQLMEKGIPDEAFEVIEGDDRLTCSTYRKKNRQEREYGIGYTLLDSRRHVDEVLSGLLEVASSVENVPDDDYGGLESKMRSYEEFVNSQYYKAAKLEADVWCSSFVCPKTNKDSIITENIFQTARRGPDFVEEKIKQIVDKLSKQYQFFHWYLAFPEVFLSDKKEGFDVILGNPPWERIKLQEAEWFAQRIPGIANARNAAERKHMISKLESENPYVYKAFLDDKRAAECESHYIRNSGTYPLCGRGDINTYSVFTELMRRIKSKNGYVGCIIPSGIATDDTTKLFFQSLVDNNSLVSLFDFENRQGIFEGVHRSYKFCLLTIADSKNKIKHKAEFMFFAQSTNDLMDSERKFSLTSDEIALINPNTHTCPVFRNNRDARIAIDVYSKTSILKSDNGDKDSGWGIEFQTMFHMSNDSHLFKRMPQLITEGFRLNGNHFIKGSETWLPLYEAKMFHQYDHRFGSYEGVPEDSISTSLPSPSLAQYQNADYTVLPRYWVEYKYAAQYLYDAPKGIVAAYFDKEYEELYENIRQWIAGFYLNKGLSIPMRGYKNKNLLAINTVNMGKARQIEREYPLEQEEISDLVKSENLIDSVSNLIEKRKYNWLFPFRGITNTTNERTFICSIIPISAVGNSSPLLVYKLSQRHSIFSLLLNLNSFVFDFIVRLKAGGTNMNFFIVKQLPVLELSQYSKFKINNETAIDWLRNRAGALVCSSYDMAGFAENISYKSPTYCWDEEQRFQIKCEVDAAYFKMYEINRDDVNYIMDTFPIIKAKDIQQHGRYRTKDTILQYYDKLSVMK